MIDGELIFFTWFCIFGYFFFIQFAYQKEVMKSFDRKDSLSEKNNNAVEKLPDVLWDEENLCIGVLYQNF